MRWTGFAPLSGMPVISAGLFRRRSNSTIAASAASRRSMVLPRMSATRVDSAYDCMRREPAMLMALALPVDCSAKIVAATITDSASIATTDNTTPTRTSVEPDHSRRNQDDLANRCSFKAMTLAAPIVRMLTDVKWRYDTAGTHCLPGREYL